jgi:hypothetical protein
MKQDIDAWKGTGAGVESGAELMPLLATVIF